MSRPARRATSERASFSQPLELTAVDLRRLRRATPGLHRWYAGAARPMPWRESRDPYAIWVSEVMLQQTQVATVRPYYARWLEALPTVVALARADEQRVLALWEGLGYYRRARMLHRAAGIIDAEHGGQLPADPATFRALPGVGAYTTAAVMSIAFGHELATVDGNVQRVLARLVTLAEDPRRAPYPRALEGLAAALLSGRPPAVHNQAMMELGALVCTPRSPACAGCPLSRVCRARAAGEPERFPSKPARKAVPHRRYAVALVFDRGRLLLEQRPYDKLLGGLWDLPAAELDGGGGGTSAAGPGRLAAALGERHGLGVRVGESLAPLDHRFTHLKVTLYPFVCSVARRAARAGEGAAPLAWVDPEAPERAMPRAATRILERWLSREAR